MKNVKVVIAISIILLIGSLAIVPVSSDTCTFINITKGDKGDTGAIPDVTQFLFLNGTRAMTGNLSMGGMYINSVLSGALGTDAVNKSYVDSKASNYNASYLTSTFNATYDAKPSSTYNATYDAKPSSTYNATYDAKPTVEGYTLYVSHLTSSPADSVANYWGMNPLAVTTSPSVRKVPIPRAGTIKEVHVAQNSGTAGSAEAYSLYVDKNGVVNNSNLVKTLSVSASIRLWDNTSMNLVVAKGDYIEMRYVNPAWATNPLTTISNGYIYIE